MTIADRKVKIRNRKGKVIEADYSHFDLLKVEVEVLKNVVNNMALALRENNIVRKAEVPSYDESFELISQQTNESEVEEDEDEDEEEEAPREVKRVMTKEQVKKREVSPEEDEDEDEEDDEDVKENMNMPPSFDDDDEEPDDEEDEDEKIIEKEVNKKNRNELIKRKKK